MPALRRISPSRYQTVVASAVKHTDKSTRLAFELRQHLGKDDLGRDFRYYVVRQGDQLDWLAFMFLGDARLWWVLADVNRDVLTDALDIPVGTRLIIPASGAFAASDRPDTVGG